MTTSSGRPADTKRQIGWLQLGVNTSVSMGLLALAISVVTGLLLAEPTSRLIEVVSGINPGWWVTVFWTILILFVLLGVPLIVLSNKPASVDLDRKLIRVGWRTVSFDQLQHVYRRPGGKDVDQAVLQLEIGRGLDARLPLSSDALPDLTLNELETLLAVLEQAQIEPKAGLPMRSPIADEFGTRLAADLVADQVGDALMPFGRVTYSKPTVNADYGRGVCGSGAKTFRRHQDNVEEWLRSVRIPVERNYVGTTAIGWIIVVGVLLLPWVIGVLIWNIFPLYYALGLGGSSEDLRNILYGRFFAAFLLWPLPAWGGLILIHRTRIRRFVADRSASLNAMSIGHTVPPEVKRFFGAVSGTRLREKRLRVWDLHVCHLPRWRRAAPHVRNGPSRGAIRSTTVAASSRGDRPRLQRTDSGRRLTLAKTHDGRARACGRGVGTPQRQAVVSRQCPSGGSAAQTTVLLLRNGKVSSVVALTAMSKIAPTNTNVATASPGSKGGLGCHCACIVPMWPPRYMAKRRTAATGVSSGRSPARTALTVPPERNTRAAISSTMP